MKTACKILQITTLKWEGCTKKNEEYSSSDNNEHCEMSDLLDTVSKR